MDSPKREDKRVKNTRQAIRNSFLKLIAEKPIERISVTELCRDAGVNRGTFYAHYTDAYDLRSSIETELYEAVLNRMKELGTAGRLTTAQMLDLLRENQELCGIFTGPHGDMEALLHFAKRSAAKYVEENADRFSDLSEQERKYIDEMLVASIATLTKCWFDSGMREPAGEIAELLGTYCLHGLSGFMTGRRLPLSNSD